VSQDFPGGSYTPIEALHILERLHGLEAKDLIADKLRDGVIRSTAGEIWDSEHTTLERAWHSRDTAQKSRKANFERDAAVGADIWRQSKHWDLDRDSWLWLENQFVITRRKQPASRTIIFGLRLSKIDVDALADSRSKRTGAPPKYVGWAKLAMAVMKIAQEGEGFTSKRFPTAASLQRALEGRVDKDNDRDKTVIGDEGTKKFVAEIYRKLIDEADM
jgi:hypothetical protein